MLSIKSPTRFRLRIDQLDVMGIVLFISMLLRLLSKQVPDPLAISFFIGSFLKEPMLIYILLLTTLYVQLIRERPRYLSEFHLLNSLPFSHKQLARHMVIRELVETIWFPVAVLLIYLAMLPITSIFFLAGFVTIHSLGYIVAILFQVWLHLTFTRPRHRFPVKRTPLFLIATVTSLLLFQFFIILSATLWAQYYFWLLMFVLSVLIVYFDHLCITAVRSWLQSNRLFLNAPPRPSKSKKRGRLMFRVSYSHPLLWKNILFKIRVTSTVELLLSGLFVFIAYAAALNNPRIEDAMQVLFYLFLTYVLFIQYRTISTMPTAEISQLLHSLPVSKQGFYISILLPSLGVQTAILIIFAVLLIPSGAGLAFIWKFFLNGFLIALALTASSTNISLALYPNSKDSARLYTYWFVVLVTGIALFYPQRILVIAVCTIVSFLSLARLHLFKSA